MNATLKYDLIEKLVNTEDESVLNQVKDFLNAEKNYWDTLSPKLKESLEVALQKVKNKDYVSHDQVIRNIKETGRA
jgi:hypothetical protein